MRVENNYLHITLAILCIKELRESHPSGLIINHVGKKIEVSLNPYSSKIFRGRMYRYKKFSHV